MKSLAILKDAVVETLDRKSLYVMMIFSALFVVILASVSYSDMDAEAGIQQMVNSFSRVIVIAKNVPVGSKGYDVDFKVSEVTKLGPDAERFKDGYAFVLDMKGPARELIRHTFAATRGQIKKPEDAIPDLEKEPTEQEEIDFIKIKFRERMISMVDVKRTAAGGDIRSYAVRIKPYSRETFEGAQGWSIFFGLVGPNRLQSSVANAVYETESTMAGFLAGWVGSLIGIIFTAGFIPNMLQKGSLDVLLARPISRTTLLLYRSLGGLAYAVISGAVFIGGSWLALSLRSGIWNWGYLASLGTLVLFFAILYSFGVLTAVLTRSTIAAILMPIGLWFLSFLVNTGKLLIDFLEIQYNVPGWVRTGVMGLYYVFPKPEDLDAINSYMIWKGGPGAATEGLPPGLMEAPAWGLVLGTSFAFIAAMMALACWRFSKKDY